MRILSKLVILTLLTACSINSWGQHEQVRQQQKLNPAQQKELEARQRTQQQAQQAEQQRVLDSFKKQNTALLTNASMEISRVRQYSSVGQYLVLANIYNVIDTIRSVGEAALYSQELNLALSKLISELAPIQTNRQLTKPELESFQSIYERLGAALGDTRRWISQMQWQKWQQDEQRRLQELQQKGGRNDDYYNHHR